MSYSDKIQHIEKEILLSSYSFADMPENDSSIWISNVDTILTTTDSELT